MDWPKLEDQIKRHEAKRNKMYADSCGVLTIGYGHNLQANPISDEAVEQIFQDDLAQVLAYAKTLPWWPQASQNDARSRAFIDFLFQMGSLNRFPAARAAAIDGNWSACADQLRFTNGPGTSETPWYTETGQRAVEVVYAIRNGADLVSQ